MNALLKNSLQLALATALLTCVARAAQAADHHSGVVVLRTSTCPAAYDDAELQHALDVELEAMHLEFEGDVSEDAAPASGVTLSTACDATGAVSLRVWSSTPRLVVERSVALRDVPETARARTLALIISEALGPALAHAAPDEASMPEHGDEPAPVTAPAPRSLGSRLLERDDPHSPWGELFTSSDPYAAPQSLRLGVAAQLHVVLRDESLLAGYEIGASGPLSDSFNWSIEASHAGNTWTRAGERDVSWWNASFGVDAVWSRSLALAVGPRLALGRLAISEGELASTERTLVTQLGARAKLDLPVADRGSVQMMLATEHTLGVLALTDYTGFDRPQRGWLLSWGVGFSVQP